MIHIPHGVSHPHNVSYEEYMAGWEAREDDSGGEPVTLVKCWSCHHEFEPQELNNNGVCSACEKSFKEDA